MNLENVNKQLNLIEQAISEIRKQLDPTALPFDMTKIAWQPREGRKGPFEISEDSQNPEHEKLLKFIGEAGGCTNTDGWFVWTFDDDKTLGRKKRDK